MFNGKTLILVGLIFLILLGFGPIIINLLMFDQEFKKVHGDFNIWIPALATYFGAIIGGFFSGLLTLLGVKYTISSEKDIRYKNSIPDKIELIRKSKKPTKTVVINAKRSLRETCKEFDIKKEELFSYASKIDNDCYNKLLEIETSTAIPEDINLYTYTEERVNGRPESILTDEGREFYNKVKGQLEEYQMLLDTKMAFYLKELREEDSFLDIVGKLLISKLTKSK